MTQFRLFSWDSVRLETAPTAECVSPKLEKNTESN